MVKSQTIDRYVDGARLPSQQIPEELLAGLQIGQMEIGNYTSFDRWFKQHATELVWLHR